MSGFCEKFASDESGPGPANSAGAIASGFCDTVVAALLESLFRLIPSPEEEQQGLW